MHACFSTAGASMALPLADILIAPTAILFLSVIAGLGTLLLLPSNREAPVRGIGMAFVILSALILVALLVHATAGMGDIGTGPYFWIFSAIALFGALRVITHPRPVYSALYFVLTVFASAGLFVLLYAEFMAAALVIIYAGAILITYVFVIMLAASAQAPGSKSPLAPVTDYDATSRDAFTASIIGFALMGVFLFMIFDKADHLPTPASNAIISASNGEESIHGTTQSIGKYLFENQLVNLELAGVILTVSMVGAIVITRRRVTDIADAFEPTSETITADMTPVDDNPHSIPVYGTTNPRQKAFPQN
jgi:NADH-quinone oxidoreductase subunit J